MSEPVDGNTQSFIVRIWYEETGNRDRAVARRGSIEHVGSRERRFFSQLADILRFIEEQAELRSHRSGEGMNSRGSRLEGGAER